MFYKKIATYDKIKFPQQAKLRLRQIFLANQLILLIDINFNPTSTKIAISFFLKVDIRQNRTNLANSPCSKQAFIKVY